MHWRHVRGRLNFRRRREASYCLRCGGEFRAAAGVAAWGPALIAVQLAVCGLLLPVVWPGHLVEYWLIFVVSFTVISAVMTRLAVFNSTRRQSVPERDHGS
jgi:hypothetical protein